MFVLFGYFDIFTEISYTRVWQIFFVIKVSGESWELCHKCQWEVKQTNGAMKNWEIYIMTF